MITELIESEKDDLRELRKLRDRTSDVETLRLVCTLLERKTERIIELTNLLHYKDRTTAPTENNNGDKQ